MKKRILYIILGVMLLSVKGMGQSFTISVGNEAPTRTCNRVRFSASYSSNPTVTSVFIWYSSTGSAGSYIRNSTPNSLGNIDAYSSGYYKVEYIDDFSNSYGFSTEVYQILIDALSVGGSIGGSTTVCTGTNSTALTLSGNTGSVTKWQSSTDAVFTSPSDIANTTSNYSADNLTSKLYYRAVVKSGVCAAVNSSNADISVDVLSVGGSIGGSTTVCTGTNSTALTLSGNTGSVTKWQSSTDAVFTSPSDIANTTSNYSADNLTSKLYYRAVVKSGVCVAVNSSIKEILVNTLPIAPTAQSLTVCYDGSVHNANAIAGPGETIVWYTASTGGITTTQPSGINANTYNAYALSRNNITSCVSATRTSVTLIINTLPAAPIANSISLDYNGLQQTTFDLISPTGQSIKWFSSSIGGVNSTKPQGTNANIYNSYASAMIDATGCTSLSRTLVTLTINKVALTVKADDKSKFYDGNVYGGGYTSSITGYVNSENINVVTGNPTYNGTSLQAVNAGEYIITPVITGLSATNYSFIAVNGSLKINKVPLIITADNKTKVYGADNPILTYTYSGLVNGDLATATWPTILTTAVANSTVGTYSIIPSAATDANYTITYVEGTLTINKAPLTITAKPHTITYNGTAYAGGNGIEPTGLAAGETISNLTGTLIYTGTSQGAKNADSYSILPDGLSSPNYNINFIWRYFRN